MGDRNSGLLKKTFNNEYDFVLNIIHYSFFTQEL